MIKYVVAVSIIAGPVNKSKLADNISPDIPEIKEKTSCNDNHLHWSF